jgi:hypothetical protein
MLCPGARESAMSMMSLYYGVSDFVGIRRTERVILVVDYIVSDEMWLL